jgi:hypothetical protein
MGWEWMLHGQQRMNKNTHVIDLPKGIMIRHVVVKVGLRWNDVQTFTVHDVFLKSRCYELVMAESGSG